MLAYNARDSLAAARGGGQALRASGSRTTSTGTCRAIATGARRCRIWLCDEGHVTAVEVAVAELAGARRSWPDRSRRGVEEAPQAVRSTRSPFDCPECGGDRAKRTKQVARRAGSTQVRHALRAAGLACTVEGSAEAFSQSHFPADYICEGLDQTRGWFYTLHAIAYLRDESLQSPNAGVARRSGTYRACLVNGLVLDKDGVKMSKRLGNIVDPWEVIGEHGVGRACAGTSIASAARPGCRRSFDREAAVLDARQPLLRQAGLNTYGILSASTRAWTATIPPRRPIVPAVAARPATSTAGSCQQHARRSMRRGLRRGLRTRST